MRSESEKREEMVKLFNKVLIYLPQIINRPIQLQGDAAKLFEIEENTFGRYIGGRGLPGKQYLFKLGENLRKYNPAWAHQYYEILEIPEPVKLNDQQRLLIDNWGLLTREEVDEIIEVAKNAKKRRGKSAAHGVVGDKEPEE